MRAPIAYPKKPPLPAAAEELGAAGEAAAAAEEEDEDAATAAAEAERVLTAMEGRAGVMSAFWPLTTPAQLPPAPLLPPAEGVGAPRLLIMRGGLAALEGADASADEEEEEEACGFLADAGGLIADLAVVTAAMLGTQMERDVILVRW